MNQQQTLIQADIAPNGHAGAHGAMGVQPARKPTHAPSQPPQTQSQQQPAARGQTPGESSAQRVEPGSEGARNFTSRYLRLAARICLELDPDPIDQMVEGLLQLRSENGRLFVLGCGGSAANAAHAVNDFRKLCNIESYSPTDNAAELTARMSEDGWETVFSEWLKTSRAGEHDALLVLSVGGGNPERDTSMNVVRALEFARLRGCSIYSILGRGDGFAAQVSDAMIQVPMVEPSLVTPFSEAFQAVIWHCLVSHPALLKQQAKW